MHTHTHAHMHTHAHSMDRDAKWLAWFEQQFSIVAGSDRQIDLEEFKTALHVKEVRQGKSALRLTVSIHAK